MKKYLLALCTILLFSACATWDGVKKDSSSAWEVTKNKSAEAWDATKEGTSKAYEKSKEKIEELTK